MENPKLGRAVLDVIDAEPQTLDMHSFGYGTTEGEASEWPCGTTACLAGHALLASGYRLVESSFYRPNGEYVGNEAGEAARLLGMSSQEAWAFWDYANGPDQFRKMVEEAEGRG